MPSPTPGCLPDQHPHGGNSALKFLTDMLGLQPSDVQAVCQELMATLGAAALAGSDEYVVPADRDLVIWQIHGGFRSSAWNTEPIINAAMVAPSTADIVAVRTGNCAVKLRNASRDLSVGDVRDFNLGALTPGLGAPLYWPVQAPLVYPSTHKIKATFALSNAAAAVVGNDAEYKILLTGALIPHRT